MTWRVIEADVLEGLAQLEDGSVQCVVTSPPYWGLRDYGTAVWDGGDVNHEHAGEVWRTMPAGSEKQASSPGSISVRSGNCACGARRIDSQLGLEPTPEAYVERMVEVFREVRRVLRSDGTVWLNLGDSYNAYNGNRGPSRSISAAADEARNEPERGLSFDGLKPKDLVGIPWRVAFALQADGWWLRSDIIWAKPNPMPESVTDRPTKAHEYVFLLTKSARYYFDGEAVRLPVSPNWTHGGGAPMPERGEHVLVDGSAGHQAQRIYEETKGANIRTVWNIATEPFPEAHFATFSKKLVEPCVKAGTSEKGCCPECGEPWMRESIRESDQQGRVAGRVLTPGRRDGHTRAPDHYVVRSSTLGWWPSCGCDVAQGPEEMSNPYPPVPCVVLDPFCGSGTTGVVATRLGRDFIGIELNPTYAEMARERIRNDGPLFNIASELSLERESDG